MNHSHITIVSRTALALALILFTLQGCGSSSNDKPTASTTAATHVVPVEVTIARQNALSIERTYSGSMEGEEQANIVAKISERVMAIHVRVGQAVRSGQVVLTLDKSGASSQFFQAEANYKNAQKNLERMKSLYAEGAISLQMLDGTQTGFDVAKANFEAARGAVELTSPIAGTVTAVNASVGDLSTPGGVLVTVARIHQMKVIFSINETDVTNVALGQKVTVYSEARPETKVAGKIIQLSKSADVGSRSFEVKAQFPNTKDAWFKPGMFGKVTVPFASRGRAVVVPAGAIQFDGSSAHVFVVRAGRAFQRTVETGASDGQNVEVLQGLNDGDTVATVGVNNVRDSALVAIAQK